MSYGILYTQNLKNDTNEVTNRKRLADLESELMVAREKGY